jgi:hypothetical protein
MLGTRTRTHQIAFAAQNVAVVQFSLRITNILRIESDDGPFAAMGIEHQRCVTKITFMISKEMQVEANNGGS